MFGSSATKTPFGTGTFGSSTNAFGATASPFGQAATGSIFGNKTNTPGYGTASTFGSSTTGSSLFGANPSTGTTGTGLFGQQTSVFGQTPSTQTSAFGGFGTGTGLFGSNQTSTTGGSLFQSPQANTFSANKSAFGATGGSLFGTNTSTTGSMFGANQQQKSLFGGTATNAATTGTTSLFGSTGFGTTTNVGTPVKFNPVKSTDTMVKSGITSQVNTTHQCITVMKEYEAKSLEELRAEDYQVGRKGPGQGTTAAPAAAAAAAGTTNTGLFSGTGFGTGSSVFGQQPQTSTTGGLFGNKMGTSLFGNTATTSTGTTAFGFGASGTTTGLFGSTPQTTQAGGLFGTTTSQPSTGLFGAGGTSTFGQTNTGTGSLFASNFGTPQAAGTSLFGAKPATGFGATSTGTTGLGTSAFGSVGTGLFGAQKPATSFGGLGTTGANFGSTFGTNTSTAGTLFGTAKPTGFGTTGITGFGGFGNTTATGTGTAGFGGINFGGQNNSLFNSSLTQNNSAQALLQQQQQQQQMQQQLLSVIAHASPYGDNPLFRNRLSNSAKTDRTKTTNSNAAHAGAPSPSHYKVSPRPSAKIKPRAINNTTLSKSKLFEGLDDDSSLNPETFVPRQSIKKLVIKSKNNSNDTTSTIDSSSIKFQSFDDADDLVAPSTPYPRSPKSVSTPLPDKDRPPQDVTPPGSDHTPVMGVRFSQNKTMDCTIAELNVQKRIDVDEKVEKDDNPSHVTLTRPEYYTEPPLDVINAQIDENGGATLTDFIVGRDGYGMVKFFGETDVTGLNLDEIVFFRRREVEVYPDSYPEKPPVGQGLNKYSEITLHKVWPTDKTSRTPIKSPDRLKLQGWQSKVEAATIKLGAVFVDYRPQSGTWVFTVEHFTRYGMQAVYVEDGSEPPLKKLDMEAMRSRIEVENKEQEKMLELKKLALQQQQEVERLRERQQLVEQQLEDRPTSEQPELSMEDDSEMEETCAQMVDAPDIMTETFPDSNEGDEEAQGVDAGGTTSASHHLASALGMDSQRIQVMKASFFHQEEDEEDVGTVGQKQLQNRSLLKMTSRTSRTVDTGHDSPVPASPGRLLSTGVSLGPGRGLETSAFQTAQPVSMSARSDLYRSPFHLDYQHMSAQPALLPDVIGGPVDKGLKVMSIRHKLGLVKMKDSLVNGKIGMIADSGLVMSRSFRVGWGPGLVLVHSGKISNHSDDNKNTTEEQQAGRKGSPLFGTNVTHGGTASSSTDTMGSHFRVVMQRVDISLQSSLDSSSLFHPFLNVQLVNSDISLNNGVPCIESGSGVKALHQLAYTAKKLQEQTSSGPALESMEHASLVWSLGVALWGQLSSEKLEDILRKEFEDGMEEEGEEPGGVSEYKQQMSRREALSQWLSSAAAPYIKREVEQANFQDNSPLTAVFSLLTGKQISAAAHLACQEANTRLAVLIAQSAGNHVARQLLYRQLSSWEEDKTDEFICKDFMKIYALLAGLMVWQTSKVNVNTCETLDWKRALAVHLWYSSSPVSSILDALSAYDQGYKGENPYARPPLPPYLEAERSDHGEATAVKDLCYHLLKLYCKRTHRLEKALAPVCYTSDQLDYRLSWHLNEVLSSLGFNHLAENHLSLLHASFAAQLEAVGLWEWSVFVMLHLKNEVKRESLVRDLLLRNCCLSESEDYIKREKFLLERLRIPPEWVHEAKALYAHYVGNHHEEAVNLLQSQHWNMSHNIILKHLSSDAIINENYQYLRGLLGDLMPRERNSQVRNWSTGGQVFLDYLNLLDWFQSLENGHNPRTAEMERILQQVSSLIHRIKGLPCASAKDRLCQSDMAKMCSNFLKVISRTLALQEDIDEEESPGADMLAPHINRLPMPEDSALSELEELVKNYTDDLTS